MSIDSRTILQGELFVALKGPNFDGHDYVADALKSGEGALLSIPPAAPAPGKTVIHVPDTLKALQDIARFRRAAMDVGVIGVTGTNGKTTTKEMIAHILGMTGKVLKTTGNLNNQIGMPLCIANMDGDETAMVLEMGSSARGEIRELCEIGRPGYAVVTNVGIAHLEGFGSVQAVRDTDLEILPYVQVAAMNADDRFLIEGIRDYAGTLVTYGLDHPADVTASDIRYEGGRPVFLLKLADGQERTVRLGVPGRFNILNALGAAAISAAAGARPDDIVRGLESFAGVPLRMQVREHDGVLFLIDAYNANPSSMTEAVIELARERRERAIAVLGDMLELGSFAEESHRKIAELLTVAGIDMLIAVGPEMTRAARSFSGACLCAADSNSAQKMLASELREGDTVLVKGSRGMLMERVLPDTVRPAGKERAHAV